MAMSLRVRGCPILLNAATHVISTITSGAARSASASEVTVICAATAHTLDTAARKMTFGANHDSSAGVRVKVEEEEEETLGPRVGCNPHVLRRGPIFGPTGENMGSI